MVLDDEKILCAPVLKAYIKALEKLSQRNIRNLSQFLIPGFRYKGPLFEAIGSAAYEDQLLIVLNKYGALKVKIFDHQWSRKKQEEEIIVFLRWSCLWKGRHKKEVIEGMSEIAFAADGMISKQQDFWDMGPVYGRMPLLGQGISYAKSKLL